MSIIKLNEKPEYSENKKLQKKYLYLAKLLELLKGKDISAEVISKINSYFEEINNFKGSARSTKKKFEKTK